MIVKKAGCIFINLDTQKVGLIYREELDDYTFAKGHLEKGETLTECAIRETAEETKRVVKIIDEQPVYINKYTYGEKCEAEVYFYLAIDIGKSNNTSSETHELKWVDVEDVENKLTYDNLKEMWNVVKPKILNLIKNTSIN